MKLLMALSIFCSITYLYFWILSPKGLFICYWHLQSSWLALGYLLLEETFIYFYFEHYSRAGMLFAQLHVLAFEYACSRCIPLRFKLPHFSLLHTFHTIFSSPDVGYFVCVCSFLHRVLTHF